MIVENVSGSMSLFQDDSAACLPRKLFPAQDFEPSALQFSSPPRIMPLLLYRERSLLVKENFTKFDAADN